jgi:hypothetical protein
MPTDSVNASIVIEFSVKPMYQMSPKVAMIDVGIAMAEMMVDRRFVRNKSTTSAARIRSQLAKTFEDRVDDFDGVRARLPADLQQHRAGAVHVRDRLGLGLAVLDLRDVRDADRVARLFPDDDVVEFGDGLHAAARAQRERLRALVHAAAWDLDVLRLHRARDVGDREVVRAQPVGVEPDVDLALTAAEDQHLADAVDALELPPQHLVGVLGDVAYRLARGEREAQDGRRIGIELVDARLLNRLGQQRQDPVHLVAHFLRGDVGVLVEDEADHDL